MPFNLTSKFIQDDQSGFAGREDEIDLMLLNRLNDALNEASLVFELRRVHPCPCRIPRVEADASAPSTRGQYFYPPPAKRPNDRKWSDLITPSDQYI